jgi:hypothetical protein
MPGFTLAAISSLAVGVAANAAISSVEGFETFRS